MTREEARHWLKIELKTWEDESKSKHPIKEALGIAIKALEQEPVLDKIRAEIESHCDLTKRNHCRYCSYCNNLMGVREILEIIDKYKGESEET